LQLDNPYKAPPGPELDKWIHAKLFPNENSSPPPYSTDDKAAEKVRSRLKILYGHRVETGTTRLRHTPYFARFDTGPSTSTEALAESLPLAICRLALVVALRNDAGE
jgi:hypothetical protein